MKKWSKELLPIALVLISWGFINWLSRFIFEGGYLPNRLNRDVQYYSATVYEVLDEDLGPDNYTGEFTVGVQEIRV